MADSEVIELSVDETNRLRVQLGLAPLRLEQAPAAAAPTDDGKEVLELSVDESNQLRANLGLPPLRTSEGSKVIHKPPPAAVNAEAAEREQQALLRQQVQDGWEHDGTEPLYGGGGDGKATTNVKDWAKQMRKRQRSTKGTDKASATKAKKETSSAAAEEGYDASALEGLRVAHGREELGETTVLTLADAPLLASNQESENPRDWALNTDDDALENVNLAEAQKQQDGLRQKRLVEMGQGRAGGYVGYDDDEFEELGGTLQPAARLGGALGAGGSSKSQRRPRGFHIGSMYEEEEEAQESDLFASGKAISLEASLRTDQVASDFLTAEEDAAEQAAKSAKFKKKKKKKDKKDKKKKSRKDREGGDDEDEAPTGAAKSSLLADLEQSASATAAPAVSGKRKRRTEADDSDSEGEHMDVRKEIQKKLEQRSRFADIMAKGNDRSRKAFAAPVKSNVPDIDDDEPDDAFLNAALAKARRLNRLQELSGKTKKKQGADVVAELVKSSSATNGKAASSNGGSGGTTIRFEADNTRDFALAIQSQEEAAEKSKAPVKEEEMTDVDETVKESEPSQVAVSTVKEEDEPEDEDVDMQELSKQVTEEPEEADPFAARESTMGRGLGGFLNVLKQTGELTKSRGREELRGRAKDERHYEDYEDTDLSQVVKIDESRATDKDKELAHRAVKLEYRDKFGRLLTRKEAYRELSHDFHGYGSGKRKQEKKKQQMAREQAAARLASQQGTEDSMLGALRKTQQATGKAFVVHKT